MKLASRNDLRLRKLMLQQRSVVQRQMLGIQVRLVVAPAVRVIDRVKAVGHWVQAHPALLVGGAALVLAWRPKAVLSMAARSLGLWQAVRRVAPMALRLWGLWQQRKPRS